MIDPKKVFERIVDTTRTIIERDGGLKIITCHLVDENGDIQILVMPNRGTAPEHKEHFVDVIRDRAHLTKSVALIIVSESWELTGKDADDFVRNRQLYNSVADHPGKKSIVCFNYEVKGHQPQIGRASIIQVNDHNTFGELELFPASEGRFVGLLESGIFSS